MRIHRNLAEGCLAMGREVLEEGRVLDRVVARAFREQRKWGKRDRHFVADSLWEVARWRRALAFIADSDDLAAGFAAHWRKRGFEIPDWWSWSGASLEQMDERRVELSQQPRAVRESIPGWLDELGHAALGDRWEPEMRALNERAPVFLRVNHLLATADDVQAWLEAEGVATQKVAGASDAFVLDPGATLPRRLAEDGRIEIQDAGSQQIVEHMELESGMRVIDACAGAGGKTLQIAATTGGSGEIHALDVSQRKLEELERRAKRAEVPHVRSALWTEERLDHLTGWADRVLIDAPCSGLGTLRRQPDLKWRLQPEDLPALISQQSDLLSRYEALAAPGGTLVYATCSLLPQENEEVIRSFLEAHANWELEDERRISPAATGWDGFYMARLERSSR